MPDLLDLDKARNELESKDLLTIERETALTWGGRAAASFAFVLEEEDHAEQMRCFWEGETYRAEAVEHAAMTEDARFLERLIVEVEGHRAKARETLLAAGHEFVEGNRTPKTRPAPAASPSTPSASSRAERLAAHRPAPATAAKPQARPPQEAPPSADPPAPSSAAPGRVPEAPRPPGPNRSVQVTPGLGRRPNSDGRTE